MKKIIYNLLWVLCIQALIVGCKEDVPELGAPPSDADVIFEVAPTSENPNIVSFSSNSSAFLKKWDFGNGKTAEGNTVQTVYPLKGTYEVTLTVFASGGSISSKQTVEIEANDLTLFSPVEVFLTGGDSKTWVIDKATAGHMGIGPIEQNAPIWWSANPDDKSDTGLYDDKFTFSLNGFSFTQATHGDVYINTQQAANFPGSYANKGDFTAPYTDKDNLTWSITEADGKKFLNVPGAFIGYYTGVSKYEILEVSDDLIYLKFADAANPAFAWYHRLIPDGFTPPPPPPPTTSTLPLDFETVEPPFVGFGGSVYSVVDNPFKSGINTSNKVGKYVKGTDGSWAGIVTTLSSNLDFSANTVFKYKVYSTVPGKALFKIEKGDDPNTFVEKFVNFTDVNQWTELTFDFAGTASDTYSKVALFLDFDNNNGGTFYIDDIRQASVPAVLTLNDLTGGSSKTWKIRAAANSFGVGPNKNDMSWWPGNSNISGDRPCLFNDEFIFQTGNVYQYDTKGDIWGEGYMGLSDGCTADSNLPANAAAWGSGTHTFSFTPAADPSPATITVTGTGAFIALPKAYNGGEYASAPPTNNGSVTYEVLGYVKTASTEELTIAVNISGGYWTFVLKAQ
jgi:hypothetical protein